MKSAEHSRDHTGHNRCFDTHANFHFSAIRRAYFGRLSEFWNALDFRANQRFASLQLIQGG